MYLTICVSKKSFSFFINLFAYKSPYQCLPYPTTLHHLFHQISHYIYSDQHKPFLLQNYQKSTEHEIQNPPIFHSLR